MTRRKIENGRYGFWIGFACVAVLAAAAAVQPAHATYPGTTDGRLAFAISVGGNTDVYSVMPGGQALHRLTEDPGFDACPAYSADGKEIAWCATRAGATEIWVMKQNGSAPRQVTSLGGSATFPDFSPDGTKIAFAARRPGASTTDIYIVNADGSGLAQLTSDPGNDRYPAWSPDGRKVVFLSGRSGIDQVWLMDADGGDQVQLTADAARKDQVPDWNPDGSKIAYVSVTGTGPGGDIWIMAADGSEQTQITSGDPSEYGAAWSADGERIAFLEWNTRTIYVMNADGTGRHAVHPLGVQFVPGWQPRGDRLS